MPRPVLLFGLRLTDLPGKPPQYRLLRTMKSRLYHMGLRGRISRNNLAHTNETRDWRIYADFAQILIAQARSLYAGEDLGFELENTVYAFDSTTIDLCLSLFPWAVFRRTKAAVRLHTLLDLRGLILSFVQIKEGKTQDARILDDLPPEPGSFYILDQGNLDFFRIYSLHQHRALFVIRAKFNLKSCRIYSQAIYKDMDAISDQKNALTEPKTGYPGYLRRVRFNNWEKDRRLTFLTNDFLLITGHA